MKVMVIVKASTDSEAGKLPTQQLLADMMQFNDQLVKAGILLAADGLKPSSQGVRVRFSGTSRSVTAGPFTETNELVAGFWLWQVKSLDEAIAWVKRCPNPMLVDSDIEIRPLFEPADFGPALTPELTQQEQQMRSQIEQRQLDPPRFERGRELLLAGYQQTYSFETRSGIPAQWARFVPHLGKIPGQVGSSTYGVSWNYQPGQGFDYLSGVEVSAERLWPRDSASSSSRRKTMRCSRIGGISRRSRPRWKPSGKGGCRTRGAKPLGLPASSATARSSTRKPGWVERKSGCR